jgi:hypothetical protein
MEKLPVMIPPTKGDQTAIAEELSDMDAVRLAVIGKLGWIKRQREKFEAQPPPVGS